MRAAWIGGALLLAGLAVWLLLPTEGTDADLESGIDELARERHGPAPVLHATPGARKPKTPDAEPVGPAQEPQGPYRFRVISNENDAPLADVEITTDEGESLGQTREDGELQFELPDESSFVFRAAKAGFVPHRGLATTRRVVEVALQPGITIKGQVIDFESTKPLKDAVVHTFDEDLGFEIASPVTNENGRFEITGVRPNHPMKLIVQAAGYVPLLRSANFEAPVDDLEIVVGEGAQLEILVRSPKDRPMPNVEVQLLPPGVPPAIHRGPWDGPKNETLEMLDARTPVLRTDEEGRCRFRAIPLGTPYQAIALATDRWFARGNVAFFIKAEQEMEQTIRLAKTSDLEVQVEDERGEPVSGVELELRSGRHVFPIHPGDRTGTGQWTFRQITPGKYLARAHRPGAPSHGEKATVRAAHVQTMRIEMPRGRSLLGRVENKQGEPIWMAQVSWGADDRSQAAATKTDAKGRFKLVGLTAASGTLRVRAVDIPTTRFSYEGTKRDGIAPGSKRMKITLLDGTRVTGTFEELAKGAAVYAAMIPGTKRDYGRIWPDREARFTRRGPPAESTALFVFKTKGLPPILHVERTPFASEERRDLGILAFEAANPLMGRVVDRQKRPLRGIKVEVAEPWSAQYVRTDADGDFEFQRMPPNRDVRIQISARNYGAREFTLRHKSQYVRQSFEFELAGAVRLLLTNQWNQAARGVDVRFREIRSPKHDGRAIDVTHKTGAQGALQVQLPAGSYQVRILHTVGNWTQWALENVRVGAGATDVLRLKLKGGKPPKNLQRR